MKKRTNRIIVDGFPSILDLDELDRMVLSESENANRLGMLSGGKTLVGKRVYDTYVIDRV